MSKGKWKEALRADQLSDGVPLETKVGKKNVLLIRSGDKIHAVGARCPHYGASLERGTFRNNILTCPCHHSQFDITSGKTLSPPAFTNLSLFETKEQQGIVYVREVKHEKEKTAPSTKKKLFVIVGSGAAGFTAALTLRDNGFDGRILILTEDADLPYDRPILSKEFLSGTADAEWIPLKPEQFYKDRQIELLRNYKVVSLNTRQKKISLAHETELPYDKLLIATGGIPKTPPIPGTDSARFFLLRTWSDARLLASALEDSERVVIIGSGFIGLEAAAACAQRGREVHVISSSKTPMMNLIGENLGFRLQKLHEKHGVRFYLGKAPEEIISEGKEQKVVLSSEEHVSGDVVIAGVGIIPSVGFLSGTGLLDEGAVSVDRHFQTDDESVYAAGDVALVPDPVTGKHRRIEHWVEACRQGKYAALAMLDRQQKYEEVPFFWTSQYDLEIQYTGWVHRRGKIIFRGGEDQSDFLAGFYERGKLRAAAGVQRNKEIILLSEVIRSGGSVSPSAFADPDTKLAKYI